MHKLQFNMFKRIIVGKALMNFKPVNRLYSHLILPNNTRLFSKNNTNVSTEDQVKSGKIEDLDDIELFNKI